MMPVSVGAAGRGMLYNSLRDLAARRMQQQQLDQEQEGQQLQAATAIQNQIPHLAQTAAQVGIAGQAQQGEGERLAQSLAQQKLLAMQAQQAEKEREASALAEKLQERQMWQGEQEKSLAARQQEQASNQAFQEGQQTRALTSEEKRAADANATHRWTASVMAGSKGAGGKVLDPIMAAKIDDDSALQELKTALGNDQALLNPNSPAITAARERKKQTEMRLNALVQQRTGGETPSAAPVVVGGGSGGQVRAPVGVVAPQALSGEGPGEIPANAPIKKLGARLIYGTEEGWKYVDTKQLVK